MGKDTGGGGISGVRDITPHPTTIIGVTEGRLEGVNNSQKGSGSSSNGGGW